MYPAFRPDKAFSIADGANWNTRADWIGDLHECDWYNRIGLDPCNRQEQMEIVRLHDTDLKGPLPMEFSIVTSLYELTLNGNMLTGEVPPEYANLSELDTLGLADNQYAVRC